MIIRYRFLPIVILIAIIGCFTTNCSDNNESKDGGKKSSKANELTQLNISFLLDLSDRIDPAINSEQGDSDEKAILSVAEYFKNHVSNKSALTLKDKMRVIFHPRPESDNISELAEDLNVNFGEENIDKESLYNELNTNYRTATKRQNNCDN